MYETDGAFGRSRLGYVPSRRELSEVVDYVTMSGWHRCNDQYVVRRPHAAIDESLVIFTMDGNGELLIGGERYTLRPGSVAVVPLRYGHAYYARPKELWEFYWMHVCGPNADRVLSYVVRKLGFTFPVSSFQSYIRCFEGVVNTSLRDIDYEIFSYEQVQALLGLILRETRQRRDTSISGCSTLAHRILEYIEKNYAEHITLEDIAYAVSISREHVIRVFKNEMGETPYQYIKRLRIDRARMLLLFTDENVGDIAHNVGYASKSAFANQFREAYGQHPAAYRRSVLRHGNPMRPVDDIHTRDFSE